MPEIPDTAARRLIRWGLYPFSWAALLAGFHLIWTSPYDARSIWAASTGGLALLYLGIEFAFPYQPCRSMTNFSAPSFTAPVSHPRNWACHLKPACHPTSGISK